jgi:hypothetical protein
VKLKNKSAALPTKAQNTLDIENARRQASWRQTGLRLAAIFLIIVFLASECAALMPVD